MDRTAIIEIEHLSKLFKGAETASVKDISLRIHRNEIYGLLGPNGAGKTTTISMLCGLFPPSSGTIRIDGKEMQRDMDDIRRIIGVVPQDIALYPTLTARENISFYGTMYGLSGKILKEKTEMWLRNFGLTEAADRRVSTYSGGMKRRVNLIAGILHDPKILFLDEPTVGVDVQSRNVIISHLKELNKAGTTIIYTSHHMEEAQHFCTNVSIIDYGEIVVSGSPAELIAGNAGSRDLEDVFLNLTNRKLRD